MQSINRDAPVMVTGATGYVAGQLVKTLLDAGLTVHAPVRDPNNAEKLKYLNELAASAAGDIKYFKADLMTSGSYTEAMEGCELIYHTASPFTLDVKDPQKELIDPAKLGTRNVLETASQIATVKRVVLTSSCAAIYGDNIDLQSLPNEAVNEDVWNTSSSLTHNPYSYSKTLAEKEAWDICQAQSQWDMIVINPSLVIGPGINPFATSESFNIIKQMGDGTMKSGAPRWGMGVVDVRDLAKAHFNAGFTPEAKGRYILSGHNSDMFSLAQELRPKYGDDFPLPKSAAPKFLIWLLGPLMDKTLTRKMVSRNINLPWKADNSKSIKELSVNYRPLADSMNDFFQQMIDSGQLKKS